MQDNPFSPALFDGQLVLVTGGGTGIGRATACLLLRCGAKVVIASRSEAHLAEGADVIEREIGIRPDTVPCDIRDASSVAAAVASIVREHGKIDILINNAGGQFAQSAVDFSPNGWRAVIDNNLNGTWNMTQAVGRHMIARQRGAIVNVIANYHRGLPGNAHTSAARAAVANLTKSLAVEWGGYGIRLNCVAPGPIEDSGFTQYYPTAVVESARRTVPLRRLGSCDEVARAIVFLASPISSWTTGTVLDVNGGQHLEGDTWVIER